MTYLRYFFLCLLSISIVSCDDSKSTTDPDEVVSTATTEETPTETTSTDPGDEIGEKPTAPVNRKARELKKGPADLVTRFQYAYFEKRFDDFHELLSDIDRKAKSLEMLEEEFNGMSIGEDIMTSYILGSSDYQADSTFTISTDSVLVYGATTAPLLSNVEREISVVLRDVGEDEEYGMLMSLLTERLKLRGGKKEVMGAQHLVIREGAGWKVRVGFDVE